MQTTQVTAIQVRSHTRAAGPTIIGMVRDAFDTAIEPITSKHLPLIAAKTGMHPTTVRLQFYRWRAEASTKAAAMARGELEVN